MFGKAKNTQIYVAPVDTVNQDQSITYDLNSQKQIWVRKLDASLIEEDDGGTYETVLATDEYVFDLRTGIWLPSTNQSSATDAERPRDVGSMRMMGVEVSTAKL